MKRGLTVLVLAVCLGVAGFSLIRWRQHEATHHAGELAVYAQHGADGGHPELQWLTTELGVTSPQIEKIRALHVAYHPICEELTHKLELSHEKIAHITATATVLSPELHEALVEHSTVHLECQRVMLKHFYETAACMTPSQAKQYLNKMLPLVFLHGTEGTPQGHSH
jgi:hypothetical protein